MQMVHKVSMKVQLVRSVIKFDLPEHAKVLSCACQVDVDGHECLAIWYLADPKTTTRVITRFRVIETGENIPGHDPVMPHKFVGTVQFMKGHYVVHVFGM